MKEILVPIAIVLIALIVIIIIGYVKAPPDEAYLISGLRKEPKVIIGKSGIRIPLLQRLDKLSLSLITCDVKTTSAVPTVEFINIQVDGIANVKVSSDPESIQKAAKNFLNKDNGYISSVVQQVLEGNMREIVGQMQLTDLVQNRELFAKKVLENAKPDMEKMGLEIINLTIQNFMDNNNIISDLGIDNVTQIKKTASIAKANGERDIAIAKAAADQEAQKAQIEAQTIMARRDNELIIEKANLKKASDIKQAEADAAYDIQKQEQRKTIEVASTNADIAKREKEVELKQQEIALKEKELDASIKKQAEADKFKRLQEAEAQLYERQKEAEAQKYEALQEAEALKAEAEARRFAAEQEATGIRAKGLAEAETIQKKAEAMKLMGEASILEMYLKALPDVVRNAAMPLANTEKIVMYGEGNSAKMVKDVMNSSSQIIEGIKESTGIDINAVLSGIVAGKTMKATSANDNEEKIVTKAKEDKESEKKQEIKKDEKVEYKNVEVKEIPKETEDKENK